MLELELLAPAGNLEKLKTAFYYGADACFFAGKKYGLRAFADNFKDDELVESVNYAHSLGKKAYVTLNIIAHNNDFNGLEEYILFLQEIGVDAVIVADVGIIHLIRQVAPDMHIHVSTQANITNKYTAKFFTDMGVKRIILARELSLKEIKEIRDFIPNDVVIETFVHGAMCMAYSGRCLLSNYMTGRDANRGACSQVCRWAFDIKEKNNENAGEYEIVEDDRGTYILNSKDLKMIEHLHELKKVGVTSFKIEGRMKSPYYVANVVNAYSRALKDIKNSDNIEEFLFNESLSNELLKSSHRKYTTGFYFGRDKDIINHDSSSTAQTSDVLAIVKEVLSDDFYLVEQRNKFVLGDMIEILSPSDSFNKQFKVAEMKDKFDNIITVANQVQQEIILKSPYKLYTGDILRTPARDYE